MAFTRLLDDEMYEATVRCDQVEPRLEHLVDFVKQEWHLSNGPAPPASPALIASEDRLASAAGRDSTFADEAMAATDPALRRSVLLGWRAVCGVRAIDAADCSAIHLTKGGR
jgi:hypothetical protein